MRFTSSLLVVPLSLACVQPALAKIETLSGDPYRGAIVVHAADGRVLFEDQADAIGYPASVLKLMTLLLVLEKVEAGTLRLGDRVVVTAEAAKMGGSQVYLKQGESFTVDELLDALMIQSANDAATALAVHVAGSRPAFVQWMNQKAQTLGMKHTRFVSVHGLPPSDGQDPDTTTARDLATLGIELARHPAVFRYTAQPQRGFRNNSFVMQNHNRLLGVVEGMDGFKTGYFRAAGYSILATAQREGVRIIAAVLGSRDRLLRDEKAKELLALGFAAVPRPPPATAQPSTQPTVVPTAPPSAPATNAVAPAETEAKPASGGWWKLALGILIGVGIAFGLSTILRRPRDLKDDLLRR